MTNRQDRNKAETCLEWYKAMATDAEKSMLCSRDSGDGERRTTAAKVGGLIMYDKCMINVRKRAQIAQIERRKRLGEPATPAASQTFLPRVATCE